MKSKQAFIVSIIIIVVVVIGLGIFMSKQTTAPSKLDEFAKSLKEQGAQFYGAFWCPHCKAQKEEFGNAQQYLPYIECSNPNQTQTQICIDEKIESYPSWKFRDGISLASEQEPIICQVQPGVEGEPAVCKQIASAYYKIWLFPGYKFSIKSPTDPVKTGNVWKFPSTAQAAGEIPLEFLAQQINYTLPQ
jgi:hypothetical protein